MYRDSGLDALSPNDCQGGQPFTDAVLRFFREVLPDEWGPSMISGSSLTRNFGF